MTDPFDRATEIEELQRQDALALQARRGGFAGKTVNDSARVCSVCDEDIPQPRRAALPGVQTCVQTCVQCQGELERAARGGTR